VTEGWMRLCSLHDVAVGTALRVKLDGQPAMAVYNLRGHIYVTADRCTHAGASLSRGVLNGDTVECPLHGCLFRITTGEALAPPCVVAVKSYDAEVQGDDVMARVCVGE
jgi:nitrite reductase/ring-hydroxylating ferredoxin subunit